jgi:hypothetical protein
MLIVVILSVNAATMREVANRMPGRNEKARRVMKPGFFTVYLVLAHTSEARAYSQ